MRTTALALALTACGGATTDTDTDTDTDPVAFDRPGVTDEDLIDWLDAQAYLTGFLIDPDAFRTISPIGGDGNACTPDPALWSETPQLGFLALNSGNPGVLQVGFGTDLTADDADWLADVRAGSPSLEPDARWSSGGLRLPFDLQLGEEVTDVIPLVGQFYAQGEDGEFEQQTTRRADIAPGGFPIAGVWIANATAGLTIQPPEGFMPTPNTFQATSVQFEVGLALDADGAVVDYDLGSGALPSGVFVNLVAADASTCTLFYGAPE